jgi:hypothetical protein
MKRVILPLVAVLSLETYAGVVDAELSAVERERLHLCPKSCARTVNRSRVNLRTATCFCEGPASTSGPNEGKKYRANRKELSR